MTKYENFKYFAMRYYLFIAIMSTSIIFLISCSKENQLLKNLEGTWDKVGIDTIYTEDSIYTNNKSQYTFEDCKENEICEGSHFRESHTPYSDTSYTNYITWELRGNLLITTYSDNTDLYFTILEWEDDYMKWHLLPYAGDIFELVRIK